VFVGSGAQPSARQLDGRRAATSGEKPQKTTLCYRQVSVAHPKGNGTKNISERTGRAENQTQRNRRGEPDAQKTRRAETDAQKSRRAETDAQKQRTEKHDEKTKTRENKNKGAVRETYLARARSTSPRVRETRI